MVVLEIEGLSFAYKDKVIFDGINLSVSSPGIIGLVAPNGTGKSTFVNLLAGTLPGFSGRISYQGVALGSKAYKQQFRQDILRMPDQFDLFGELSGRDHLNLYHGLSKSPKPVEEVIDLLQMGSYVHKKVSSYSLGMRQRLAFAMALVANPRVFLLDEIMNSLDPMNVQLISEVLLQLVEEGKIIFLVSHILDNLEALSDRVVFLRDRQIILEYAPKALQSDYLVFEFAEGVSAEDKAAVLGQCLPSYVERDGSFAIDQDLTSEELRGILEAFLERLSLFRTIQLGPKSCQVFYQELYL